MGIFFISAILASVPFSLLISFSKRHTFNLFSFVICFEHQLAISFTFLFPISHQTLVSWYCLCSSQSFQIFLKVVRNISELIMLTFIFHSPLPYSISVVLMLCWQQNGQRKVQPRNQYRWFGYPLFWRLTNSHFGSVYIYLPGNIFFLWGFSYLLLHSYPQTSAELPQL